MLIEQAEALKEWLVKELTPVSDADPVSLARYVLALLKKDKSENELKEFCVEQLDVFLGKETRGFVSKVFAIVKNKKYMADIGGEASNAPAAVEKSRHSSKEASSAKTIPKTSPPRETKKSTTEKTKTSAVEKPTTRQSSKTLPATDEQPSRRGEKSEHTSHRHRKDTPPTTKDEEPSRSSRRRVSPPVRDAPRVVASKLVASPPPTESTRRLRERSKEPTATGANTTSVSGVRTRLGPKRGGTDSSPTPAGGHHRQVTVTNDTRERSRSPLPSRAGDAATGPVRRTIRPDGTDIVRRVVTTANGRTTTTTTTAVAPKRSHLDEFSTDDTGATSDEDEDDKQPMKRARKQRCKDYDEKGFCMLGEQCAYDHGPDPVVINDRALPEMLQRHVVTKLPNMRVPPPSGGVGAHVPPPPGVETTAGYGQQAATGAISVYPPSLAYGTSSHGAGQQVWTAYPPPNMSHPPPGAIPVYTPGAPPPGYPPLMPTLQPGQQIGSVTYHINQEPPPQQHVQYQPMPVFRGRGRGRVFRHLYRIQIAGRGGFTPGRGGHFTAASGDPHNKTLLIIKIPPQQNDIATIDTHFKQFGTITNIKVCHNNQPDQALITFADRYAAIQTLKSTQPILNNRFIRVFWYDENTGVSASGGDVQSTEGGAGAESDSKTPADSNVRFTSHGSLSKTLYNPQATRPPAAVRVTRVSSASAAGASEYVQERKMRRDEKMRRQLALDLYKRKHELLAQTIQEQKALMAKIETAKSASIKKELIQLFKTLDARVKTYETEITQLTDKLQKKYAREEDDKNDEAATKAAVALRAERQRVQTMLDAARKDENTVVGANGGGGATLKAPAGGAESTALKERLASLKRELIELNKRQTGGDAASNEAHSTPVAAIGAGINLSPRGGAGGRGGRGRTVAPLGGYYSPRGRGGARGRGGSRVVPPSIASLDKRPRNILVAGFTKDERDELIVHMQQFGECVSCDLDATKDGDLRAHCVYKTRKDAEQAIELAGDFKDRQITVAWGPAIAGGSLGKRTPRQSASGETVLAAGGDGDGPSSAKLARTRGGQLSATQLLASLGDEGEVECVPTPTHALFCAQLSDGAGDDKADASDSDTTPVEDDYVLDDDTFTTAQRSTARTGVAQVVVRSGAGGGRVVNIGSDVDE